jgi:hypothetical protein
MVRKYPRPVATLQALRVIDQVLAKLPESVRRTAPDYAGIRRELLAASERAQRLGPEPETRTESAEAEVIAPAAPEGPPKP